MTPLPAADPVAPGAPPECVAVSVPLPDDGPIDPRDATGGTGNLAGIVYAGPGRSFLTSGVAAVLALPRGLEDPSALASLRRWLAAVPHEVRTATSDDARAPAPHVCALGALPFLPGGAGTLVVPRVTLRRDPDGRRWATLVAPAPGPDEDEVARVRLGSLGPPAFPGDGVGERGAEAPAPTAIGMDHCPDPAGYRDAVLDALGAIGAGALAKVVLARAVSVRLDADLDVGMALRRLGRLEPSCTLFAFPLDGGAFVGATPELLVRRDGHRVQAHPLAGTVRLGEDPAADRAHVAAFLASAKDRVEHALVVDQIVAALAPLCSALDAPAEPSLVRLHSVAHFGTDIEGSLADGPDGDPPDALTLAAALHPTPAVGGVPLDPALAAIARLEPFARGRWAGPVGWLDASGDGEWMLALRCATVHERTLTLLAGAGIVAGSDPDAELAETTVKLEAVLAALAPSAVGLLRWRGGSAR